MGNDDLGVLAAHILAAGLADQASLWVGILVGIATLIGSVAAAVGGRRRAKERAAAELAAAVEQGKRSRDDEVALLRSELRSTERDRDTAERNEAEARRNEAEARRTLAMMQRPISEYRLDDPPRHPRPGGN